MVPGFPRSAGGGNGAENVATSCLSCNRAKGDGCWRAFAGARAALVELLRLRPLDRPRARRAPRTFTAA